MRRCLPLLALLLLVPLPAQQYDPFLEKMIRFDKAWMVFKLEYLGCPSRPQTDTYGILVNCTGTGSINLKKLRQAGKLAEDLFDLQAKPQ